MGFPQQNTRMGCSSSSGISPLGQNESPESPVLWQVDSSITEPLRSPQPHRAWVPWHQQEVRSMTLWHSLTCWQTELPIKTPSRKNLEKMAATHSILMKIPGWRYLSVHIRGAKSGTDQAAQVFRHWSSWESYVYWFPNTKIMLESHYNLMIWVHMPTLIGIIIWRSGVVRICISSKRLTDGAWLIVWNQWNQWLDGYSRTRISNGTLVSGTASHGAGSQDNNTGLAGER